MKKASFIVLQLFCLVVFLCAASQSQAQTANCTYSLNLSSRNVSFAPGGGTINITTQPNCSWEWRTNNPTWLTAENTGETTVGNGFLTYYFAGNTGPDRTGTITIAGLTFTINQVSGCSYSLSTSNITLSSSGGSGSFTLTASNVNCSWSVFANERWLTFTGSTSGTGNATVTFTLDPNNGFERSVLITIGNYLVLPLTQAAQPTLSTEYINTKGRVLTADNKPVRGVLVTYRNTRTNESYTAITNPFGYFHFAAIERGQAHNVTISHKRYKFSGTRTVTMFINGVGSIFTANPEQ